MLTYSIADAPTDQSDSQLQSITVLCDASASWSSLDETPAPTATILLPSPDQTRQSIRVKKRLMNQPKLQHPIPPHPNPKVPNEPAPCYPYPRVKIQHHLPEPPPRVHPKETAPDQPISRRTRSHTLNSQPPVNLAMPVLNADTGEYLDYRQLRHHTKYPKKWE